MPFNIDTFRSQYQGGIRPTQFQIIITPPAALSVAGVGVGGTNGSSSITETIAMMAHATTAPPMIQDSVRVYYFGRPIKVAGDRDYPDWTVSIYNDNDFAVRNFLESWQNLQNTIVDNVMDAAAFPSAYKGDAQVIQYERDGSVAKTYNLVGIFPVNIDAMTLGWDAVNQVQTFDTTFAMDYWLPSHLDGLASQTNAG